MKIEPGKNLFENFALTKRLDALGIPANQGQFEDADAKNVKGGLAALQTAAGVDGRLSLAEAAQLSRNVGFLKTLLGRDASISEKATNALKSFAMEARGLTAQMEATAQRASYTGMLSANALVAVGRRAEHFSEQMNKILVEGGDVARADPKAIAQAGDAIAELAEATSRFGQNLSLMRSAALGAETPSWTSSVAQKNVLDSLFYADRVTQCVGVVVDKLAQPS